MACIEDNIWKDLESLMEESETIKLGCDSIMCLHINKEINQKEGNIICKDCGLVILESTFETCEWNNYKQDDGKFSANNQRGDLYVSDNPYDISGTIPGINKNSLMMRIHYQQTFSHKQKTFWKVSEKLQNYCTHLKIHVRVMPTVKDMWHICMEYGKITRASVRNGLISSCLYYSCIFNNIPIDRQSLIDITEGNQKGFLKGEKIFQDIMQHNNKYKHLGKEKINIKENDSFVKYCNQLDLPFRTVEMCNNLYITYLDRLDSVTPKSSIAGIIQYVVKFKLKLKQPSKSKISKTVDVCIPTINKVVLLLESFIED